MVTLKEMTATEYGNLSRLQEYLEVIWMDRVQNHSLPSPDPIH
jgi:hypothetical protein